ncbi:hypothetical protein ACFQVA_12080 [Actinomadura keratinilytica]
MGFWPGAGAGGGAGAVRPGHRDRVAEAGDGRCGYRRVGGFGGGDREVERLLPVYTARIEAARANNRQGLPLGGAWLRNANDLMQEEMLPAAERLYQAEKERLRTDYATAQGFPWVAVGLGVLTVGALGGVQHALYRRTNRRFNVGLLGATAACGVLLVWVTAGHTLASAGLSDSYEHGVRSLNVLNDARISALKARGGENLTLVARGP